MFTPAPFLIADLARQFIYVIFSIALHRLLATYD